MLKRSAAHMGPGRGPVGGSKMSEGGMADEGIESIGSVRGGFA